MRVILAGLAALALAGTAQAGEAKYNVEQSVKVYRFGPTQADIAARKLRAKQAQHQQHMQAKRSRHMAAKAKREAAIRKSAYQKGRADGLAEAIKAQPKQLARVRSGNRRYSTYLGISPYNRRAYRSIYGRPLRARTAIYVRP